MASLTIDDNSIISDDDYDCSYQNHFLLPLLLTSYKYILYQLFNEEEKIYFLLLFLLLLQSECRIFLLKFTYFYGYVSSSCTKQ